MLNHSGENKDFLLRHKEVMSNRGFRDTLYPPTITLSVSSGINRHCIGKTKTGPITHEVEEAILEADRQIGAIITRFKNDPKLSETEMVDAAKKLIGEKHLIFNWLRQGDVKVQWFDTPHGPRSARNAVLPRVAAEYGVPISGEEANKILMKLRKMGRDKAYLTHLI